MSEINPKLNELVNALPGIYQPIYGHSEWDQKAQRDCQERLPEVKKIYDELSAKLQRPLRVLDLRDCYGYFGFHICKWGGVVVGVDSSKQFVEICNLLASEHPDFKIKFVQENIQKFIPSIKEGEYDLVLCFSMLHWATQQSGFQNVQKLLTDLAEKIPVGLFELARAAEFPDLKLPANYRDYLKGYFFVRVLKYCNWRNMKNSQRPLLFASKKYAHFDEFGILKIDHVMGGNKKHFQSGDKFIKIVNASSQRAFEMVQNEIKFLQELGGKNGLPRLHATIQEDDETGKWTFIIRDNIKGLPLGNLLSEKVSTINEESARWNIVEQILRWLIFLEKHGYYQTDLQPWNFVYKEDGKIIPVDYELMKHELISHRWPFNVRLTMFSIINTILDKKDFDECHFYVNNRLKYYSNGNGLTDFSKYVSEDNYRRILALHDDEKFFENLYEILFSTPKLRSIHTIAEVDILEKEQYLRDLGNATMSQEKSINSLSQTVSGQQKRIEQLEGSVKKFNETTSQEKLIAPLTQKLSEQQKRIEELEGAVKKFNETTSQEKLIAPLTQKLSEQQKQIEQLEDLVTSLNERFNRFFAADYD